MKDIQHPQRSLNKDYYINTINYSVDSCFESMADEISEKLSKLEQMHINISKLFTSTKYDKKVMDLFADEIDHAFHLGKNKIKNELESSICNYISRLESISLKEE